MNLRYWQETETLITKPQITQRVTSALGRDSLEDLAVRQQDPGRGLTDRKIHEGIPELLSPDERAILKAILAFRKSYSAEVVRHPSKVNPAGPYQETVSYLCANPDHPLVWEKLREQLQEQPPRQPSAPDVEYWIGQVAMKVANGELSLEPEPVNEPQQTLEPVSS